MPVSADVYTGFKPLTLATFGEIVDARSRRAEQDSLTQERLSTTAERNAQTAKSIADQHRQAQEDAAVQSAFAAHATPNGPDWDGVIADLYKTAPTRAAAIETAHQKSQADAVKTYGDQLDADAKSHAQVAQALQDATPETLPRILPLVYRVDPAVGKYLSEHPDADTIKAVSNAGTTASEHLAAQKAALEQGNTDTERALNLVSLAKSQSDIDDALGFAQHQGVADKLKAYGIGTTFDPSVPQRAAALTMTPEQRATVGATSLQSKDVLVNGKRATVNFNPKTGQYLDPQSGQPVANVAPIPPASTIINPQDVSDVKEAVAGMKDGSVPPQLPGRASKEYTAMMAEAHRQGYDLASAATDWLATQKHIATLNGAQQTRLAQAIDNASHSLDVIDDLADQWNGGKFPILNKPALIAAKNGALGAKAQNIATQLEAQIADVTGELGNVYMGGNSPTDQALGLASKNLSADWTRDQLKAATALARKNLQIRTNSIKNAGVAGVGPDNPYAPPPAVAPPTGRYNPVTGKLDAP